MWAASVFFGKIEFPIWHSWITLQVHKTASEKWVTKPTLMMMWLASETTDHKITKRRATQMESLVSFLVWRRQIFSMLLDTYCAVLGHSVMSKSATSWTVARQAPLSMEFSSQEYWSGLPCPPPGDLPNPGIEPRSLALQADSLPSELSEKPKNTGLGTPSLHQGIFLTQ